MKKLTYLFVFFSVALFAQKNVEFEKANFPDQKDAFKTAIKELEAGNEIFGYAYDDLHIDEDSDLRVTYEMFEFFKKAKKHYDVAYEFNPNNALLNFRMGYCILYTINKDESIEFFEKAYKMNSTIHEEITYCLGAAHHLHGDWDDAITFYNKYLLVLEQKAKGKAVTKYPKRYREVKHRIDNCNSGKVLSAKPSRVFIDNIGDVINTPYSDFGVMLNADESMLMFTSRRPGSTGSKEAKKETDQQDYFEDIYIVKKNSEGKWTTPMNAGDPLNTDAHDATVFLDPDGQTMLMYRDDKGGGGIYRSELQGLEWSKPKALGKNINTDAHETSAAYSLDHKTLYFVSNKRDGSMGGHDIFYSEWDEEKERWGVAKNIGNTINTSYDEEGVFMHPDGKTLYFSSKGHNSMGGYDIFKSVYENGKWSKPENLGYPVNGPDDDVFFVMSANKKRGYYASWHEGGYGEKDIYVITFLGPEKEVISMSEDNLLASAIAPVTEEIIEPEVAVDESNTTILKGVVVDAVTLKPVAAKIDLIDNTKNEKVATFHNNSSSGNFLLSLPAGRNYGIAVYADDYLFHSENFDIPKTDGFHEVYKEIQLKNIAVGSSIVLKNIFFDYDKATLRQESVAELKRLIDLLTTVPSMKIEISGHTDKRGSEVYNQSLSEKRAKSVVDYLIKNGIKADRLTHVGYGESKPIRDEETEEAYQENRRTEFKILSK